MSQPNMLIEVIGWLGAAVLLVAYGLVSYGWVGSRSLTYQALNIVGGLLLAINSGWHRAWPSVALNVIWTGIGVGSLVVAPRLRQEARQRHQPP
jgi:hypothetical protein